MSGPGFRLHCEVDFGDGAKLLDEQHVRVLVAAALFEAGAAAGEDIEVGVGFCGTARMRELNAEHRGMDAPTDVLSFPIDGLVEPLHPGMPRQLGDVVVCPAYVQHQLDDEATMLPHGPGREEGDATLEAALERCVVHGVLHLAGFDHERDEDAAREMFALEQLVLERVRATQAPG